MSDVAYYQELLPLLNISIEKYWAQVNDPANTSAKRDLTRAYVQLLEEVRDSAILGRSGCAFWPKNAPRLCKSVSGTRVGQGRPLAS